MSAALAILVFAAVSTGLAACFFSLSGFLPEWLALGILLCGAAAGFYCWQRSSSLSSGRNRGFFNVLFSLLFLIFCLRHFVRIYFYQDGMWHTVRSSEFDFPRLLSLMMHFKGGVPLWPENPLLAGESIHDFGVPLLTMLFHSAGLPLTLVFAVTGFLAAVLLLVFLLRWAGAVGVCGFLCLGGGASVLDWAGRVFPGFKPALAYEHMMYGMLPFFEFVSRSGLWFAFPAGLALLWSWRERFFRRGRGIGVFAEALLWGILPLFDFFSFAVITFVFVIWVFGAREFGLGRNVFLSVLPLALPGLFLVTGNFGQFSSVCWLRLRSAPEIMKAFYDYVYYFFYVVPWFFWVAMAAFRSRERHDFLIVLPVFFILAGLLVFEIGPTRWQEQRIAAWGIILFLGVLQDLSARCWKPTSRRLLLGALFFPGFMAQVNSLGHFDQPIALIEAARQDDICRVLEPLPRGERLGVILEMNEPVSLCGYPVVTNMNDWLFYQDTPQRKVSARFRQISVGDPAWRDLARQLGLRYLFWSRALDQDIKQGEKPWEELAARVASGPWGTLYDFGNQRWMAERGEADYGLGVRLFANEHWEGEPLMEGQVETVNFFWEDGGREVLTTPWSMIFEGEVYVPESGEVIFYLMSDDGSDFEIDGGVLIDNLGIHAQRIRSGRRYFEEGWYPVKVRFFDVFGASVIKLWWQLPSGGEDYIPAEYFRPPRKS